MPDTVQGCKKRFEYSGGKLLYEGTAQPGKATSEAEWQIKKYEYSGDDLTEINFADGTAAFTKIWDNRASYSYS